MALLHGEMQPWCCEVLGLFYNFNNVAVIYNASFMPRNDYLSLSNLFMGTNCVPLGYFCSIIPSLMVFKYPLAVRLF